MSSEGVPSETGMRRDAAAALRYVCSPDGVDAGAVVYYGVSMGGGLAVWLAGQFTPAALILESAPPSLPEVAAMHYRVLRVPDVRRMIQSRFETAHHLLSVRAPVLVVHGETDDVVPLRYGREVFAAAPEPKEWLPVPGAGHNRPEDVAGDRYYAALAGFIQQHAGIPARGPASRLQPRVTGAVDASASNST